MTTGTDVCALDQLVPERAVAALVEGRQLALVRTHDDAVFAVGQHDPYCGANVMSRGLVGSTRVGDEDVPTLQSPMYKQAFDLRTGAAVGDAAVCLGAWQVSVVAGRIRVGAMTRPPKGVSDGEREEAAREAADRNRAIVDGAT